MPEFTDQIGHTINLDQNPVRIISLVPSQTELLAHLGLDEEVLGITKFCVHPEKWFRNKTRVGGTKKLDIEKILSLKPDLILANKEENTREEVEMLAKNIPVWTSDIANLDHALEMIISIGNLTGKTAKAENIIQEIRTQFNKLEFELKSFREENQLNKLRCCYLIWQDPFMTTGGDTFISNMMEQAGLINVFEKRSRYPEVSETAIRNSGCECLLLSSEPYPFKEKHLPAISKQFPEMKILLVDGEIFSWYGSRLLKAPSYFMQLKQQVLSLKHASGN